MSFGSFFMKYIISFNESLQNFKLISFIINSLFVLIPLLILFLSYGNKFIFIIIPFSHSIMGTKPLLAIIDPNCFFLSLIKGNLLPVSVFK